MGPKQPVAGPSRIKANATQAPPPPAPVAAFNPSRTLFACAQPVLGSADKLTVWDIIADRVIAEWEVEGAAKATTVSWGSISSGAARKKRKKKSNANGDGDEDVVALTTDKGGLVVFAPRRGEVIRRLDVGRVHAVASDDRLVLVTAKEVLVVDSDLSAVSHTFALPAGTQAPTSASLLPTSTADVLHLLIASASVLALHLNVSTGKVTHTSAPLPVSTSSVSSLVSLPSSPQGASFLVVSADDRSVSQYTLSTPTAAAKLSYRYASPTLSPVHSVTYSSELLSALHSSGEISLFSLPKELDFARPKSDSKPSLVKLVEGKEDRPVRLAGVAFAEEGEAPGSLLCGRLFGGGRVKWVKAVYEQPEGGLRAETVVKTDAQDLVGAAATQNSIPVQRFSAPSTTVEIPAEQEESAPALPADVDAADLSLGERLLALPTTEAATPAKALPTLDGPVNAASLTRLLVQALHTSDPALLTLCLSHRDPALIRNTIRKMPTQLALPLLKACVERLGQGKGSGKRGGGRGVAANEQQGRGTVEWVKGVLVERGSILMTMPSLPVHLATLSSLLQTRMQLYQPLLSLSGRLDLALAQISMRRLAAEASAYAESKGEGAKYIEGESDDEDSDDDEVHVEVGDEDGEIEDVDMMDRSDDDSEEDDSEDEDSDPLESGSEDGFLDLEAEESGSGEEESDEE